MNILSRQALVATSLISIFFLLLILRQWSVIDQVWLLYLLLLGGLVVGLSLTTIDEKIIRAYYDPDRKEALVTQSIVFVAACLPLSLLMMTSSASFAGGGLVMGIALSTLLAMWQYRTDAEQFEARFLSQLKRPLVDWERNALIGVILTWNVLLWIAMLR